MYEIPARWISMLKKASLAAIVGLVAVAAAACSGSTPSQPTPSLSAPVALSPTDNSQVRNADQPITLTVQNVAATGSGTTTYTFEVATDSAFASKVQTKDGVAEGSGNQTSVRLDALPSSRDYFWHARAQRGGTIGTFGSASRFSVGTSISLSPPTAIGPLTGSQATVNRPTFAVTNAARQGSTGAISYQFELALNSNFSPITFAATIPEGTNGQTSFTPTIELTNGTTYFWRCTAVDQANGVSSTPSTTQSFTSAPRTEQQQLAAELGVILWPGIQPAIATGRAILGDNWNVQTLYHAPTRTTFVSPTVEELRLFDLMDRGLSPQGAIDWMLANGYPTTAAYYPSVQVIGVPYEYMALINGKWDLILRAE